MELAGLLLTVWPLIPDWRALALAFVVLAGALRVVHAIACSRRG